MREIIKSLWIGPRLSTLEQLTISSFLANGHDFHLYVYDDVKDIPSGTIVKDANEILHESRVFVNKKRKTYAAFSNSFRYEMLQKVGGLWVDMDLICLKPFDFTEEYVFGEETRGRVAVGALKLPQGSEALAHLQRITSKPNEHQPWDKGRHKFKKTLRRYFSMRSQRTNVRWGELGPQAIAHVVRHYGLERYIRPFTAFYPVPGGCWHNLFDETFTDSMEFFNGSYAVHMWNEFLRREKGFDKDGVFPKNSVYEILKRKYL